MNGPSEWGEFRIYQPELPFNFPVEGGWMVASQPVHQIIKQPRLMRLQRPPLTL